MKNIYVLPTNKPSRLFTYKDESYLYYIKKDIDSKSKNENCQNQNIYITSDEEIKEGDWYLYCNQINKRIRKNPKAEYPYPSYQKIILTTDQDLIKDGVQSIDDKFLEWFVKNPSCEEVEVEKNKFFESVKYNFYKIIIPKEKLKITNCGNKDCQSGVINGINPKICRKCNPKEEPKQDALNHFLSTSSVIVKDPQISNFNKQETLEEAAENSFLANKLENSNAVEKAHYIAGFRESAKWQMDKQDNFIIGFLEFIEGTYSYSNIFDYWYLHADTSKTYTKKELLKKYTNTLNGN